MIKATVNVGDPLTIGPWEIVIVESTKSVATLIAGGLAATAMRQPVAIVVRHPEGDRTFSLEEVQGVPGE